MDPVNLKELVFERISADIEEDVRPLADRIVSATITALIEGELLDSKICTSCSRHELLCPSCEPPDDHDCPNCGRDMHCSLCDDEEA